MKKSRPERGTEERLPEPRVMDWSSLQYRLLWAYDGAVIRKSWEGRYTDEATSCWLIRRGSVRVETGGKKVWAREGDWVFVASPTRVQKFSPDNRILSLHFQLQWPGGEQVVDRTWNRTCRAEKIPELEKGARPLIRLLRKNFPGVQSYLPAQRCGWALYLKMQALLLPFIEVYLGVQEKLGRPVRVRAGQDEALLQVLAALDRLPLREILPQKELAKKLGYSRSRLDALFTSRMGRTPRRYLQQRRLEEARQLLRGTDKSVKTIALELGFRHESHFCLWFKKEEGKRPGELKG